MDSHPTDCDPIKQIDEFNENIINNIGGTILGVLLYILPIIIIL